MKTFIITLIISLLMSQAFGQTEKATYKTVADKFELYYNANHYDSIFAMFSDDMQKALPVDKTSDFLAGLQSSAGKITKRTFTKYVNGTYAQYKTNFEQALLAVDISINDNGKINGLLVKPYIDESLPVLNRNVTKLQLPFSGEWTVIWGGDTKELNYHVESQAQKNAFDILITDASGHSHRADGEKNEDYYAFGKQIVAPCDGEVVLSVDGVKDNKPGVFNSMYVPGNSVMIKTANDEYLFFAHFKNHSIVVKEGQKIIRGQLLGLCGNSGNSSEPHLHFHIQNVEDMSVATGVKCYFDTIIVNKQLKKDYSPIKGDKIKNE